MTAEAEAVADLGAVRDARWPEACLASERKFGQRVARLYPLIGVGGGVATPVGQATLFTAFSSGCQVLPTRGRPERVDATGKMYRPLVEVTVEEVEPYPKGVTPAHERRRRA